MTKHQAARAQAWKHKLELDKLQSFSDKLLYWRTEVCIDDLHFSATFLSDPEFTLSLEPQTEDEVCQLRQFWLDWYRQDKIAKQEVIYVSAYVPDRYNKAAFRIKSLNALKSDLEQRISRAIRKNDLLVCELSDVTNALDAAGKKINDYIPRIARLTNTLRGCLTKNLPFNLLSIDEVVPIDDIITLSQIWDLVHYESYLKDELEKRSITQGVEYSNKEVNTIVDKRAYSYKTAILPSSSNQKPATRANASNCYALVIYYAFIHETHYEMSFENHPLGKMAAIAELVKRHNLGSEKRFQLKYNEFTKPSNIKNRLSKVPIKSMEAAITLLADYPAAQMLAKDSLKIMELSR